MRNRFNFRLYALFAAWTLVIVVAVAAIVLSLHLESIRTLAEDDTALTTNRIMMPALQREAGDLTEDALASFTDLAGGLLNDDLRAIRLWSTDGTLLAAAGAGQGDTADQQALRSAAEGSLVAFKTTSPGGDLLVSYAALGPGAVLEIQQDYGPVAASVTGSWRILLLSVIAGAIVLLLLVQAMLWFTTHDLKRDYEHLLYLHRAGQAIRSTLDLPDVLAQLARDAALCTRAQLALIALVEEESNDLLVQASYDWYADATTHHHRRVEEWYLRRCAGTGETLQAQQPHLPYVALLGYEPRLRGAVNLLCVPIPGRERTTGVLMVVKKDAHGAFKASEVEMVDELAAQASMAAEQAMLFAKLRTYAEEVEAGYDSTLKVLSAALDTKDQDTQGHSERVARLTVALARAMDVPGERLVDIERGALLHDVGKIGVPDEVLRKPASLNEREWEAMQKHPLLAGLMVSKVGFLEGALPILLYHHERYDGSGYPFGLEGHAIPLEARIFAVVDAYDAMTSDRPYRKAMPHADALAEIHRNAGVHFDPQVVEAFTKVITRAQPADEAAA